MYLSQTETNRLRRLLTADAPEAAAWVKTLVSSTIRECFARHGWDTRLEPVGSELSTLRSVLVPMRGGGFTAVVNARKSPSDAQIDWLLAHEYAHTFFYLQGKPPRRAVKHSLAEELACDHFADAFIGANRAAGAA